MKKIIFVLLLLPLFSIAQADTAIKYSEVITVDNTTKDLLFQRGRAWFNDAFKSMKNVLQVQDKETGELVGKGTFKTSYVNHAIVAVTVPVMVDFDIKLYVKDGKYKYSIENLKPTLYNMYGRTSMEMPMLTSGEQYPDKLPYNSAKKANQYWAELKANSEKEVNGLISTLKLAMAKTAPTDF
jgi:hypothetical protein